VLKKRAADGRLTPADKDLLVARLTDPQARIRELVLYYFKLVGAPATPAVRSRLIAIIQDDPSPYARELAMVNLRSSFGAVPLVTSVLKQVMTSDKDHAVQTHAAVALATAHARTNPGPTRQQALAGLDKWSVANNSTFSPSATMNGLTDLPTCEYWVDQHFLLHQPKFRQQAALREPVRLQTVFRSFNSVL